MYVYVVDLSPPVTLFSFFFLQFMIMSSQAFLLTVTPNEGGAAQGQTISGYKDLKKSLWDS